MYIVLTCSDIFRHFLRFGFVFSYALMLSRGGPVRAVIGALVAALASGCSVTLVVRFNMQLHPAIVQ